MNSFTGGRFDRTDHALVIGLGRSGRASVEVLRTRLGSVSATDEASRAELADALDELRAANVAFVPPDELDAALENVTVGPLIAIIIGIFMVILDGTAVNVALPKLVADFHTTLPTLQ